MAELLGLIPTTVGGVVGLLVEVLIIWIAVMVADKIIAHQIEAKHSLILAALAYFLAPLILAFAAISIPFAGIIVPLLVWIVLGELLLRGSGDFKARLKVAAVAFMIYLILTILSVPAIISDMIGV